MTKQLLKTLVAVLAIAAAAAGPVRAQSNPTKYTSAVAMSALQVGDTLAEGFSLTGEDANFIYLVANRHKHNENLSGFLESISLDQIQSISANCVFSTLVNEQSITFAPVDENGQDCDAWVVTEVESIADFTNITIAGIRIPGPPITVRMAAGTVEAANWTLSSGDASVTGDQVLENVMSGSELTATYSGNRKVKSVKAVKYVAEPVSLIVNPVVGQIIGSDGKNYDANATLPTGVTAVAKICYVGSDNGEAAPYNHGLALALSDVSSSTYTWCSQFSETCLASGHQYNDETAAKGDMAGLANTDALVGHSSHTHNAASAARNYNGGTHPTGTSEWFLPSAGQWDKMATAAGGYETLEINAGLQSSRYWSSSERSAGYAWRIYPDEGVWDNGMKDGSRYVRACLAF